MKKVQAARRGGFPLIWKLLVGKSKRILARSRGVAGALGNMDWTWRADASRRSPEYRELELHSVGSTHVGRAAGTSAADDIKLVAYYLPQFHPIPQNDAWWGKGFTEWTNVGKALPQFVGHSQPRLPGELGYYDLRVREVMHRQIELAKNYGIHAFCFHYYWFSGERLLEKPLDDFVTDPAIDFPFAICWANENWTRRWDGQEKKILKEQRYTLEDRDALMPDMKRYLQHRNYLRIGGRPLIIVYKPMLIPDIKATVERWRAMCRASGVGEIYLVGVQWDPAHNPTEFGFDAMAEFPPVSVPYTPQIDKVRLLNPAFAGSIYDYSEMVQIFSGRARPSYELFRGVTPGWDNTARRGGNAWVFRGATPAVFGQWLRKAMAATRQAMPEDRRLVFINAWNEWAEGAYLEPDHKFGYAYLQECWDALQESQGEQDG
ncbi:MAG TPA: glycoside hydrolase family 99-like domain-containing protein [Candidatus Thermoplasmatota archaeon]|nr:glycoside hydrolase family 99-like domain-containing protein [Candidatus Thermoplasmatota archaeon]